MGKQWKGLRGKRERGRRIELYLPEVEVLKIAYDEAIG
jgi:hypothetical protein